MKLISLTCDQNSFKSVYFNHSGLSIIVGDGAKEINGTSNGVGKTLSLKLIHHCLGANADPKLANAVPDWIFTLHFQINEHLYKISRTGDGKSIWLLDKPIKTKELRTWLNEQDIFQLEENLPNLTFRSLIKRFTRLSKPDCEIATKTEDEDDYSALLRTMFLMGVDCNLVISKHQTKQELTEATNKIKQYQEDPMLLDFFRAGTQPKVRLEHLEREIPRLENDLNNFKVAQDYREIEIEANSLTSTIREISFKQDALNRQFNNINQIIKEQPDISKDDLLALYKGIETVFKPEALQHFDAVEKFHHSLAANRKQRLEEDKQRITQEIELLNIQRNESEQLRDKKFQYLHGKKALDDYLAISQQLSNAKEEHQRLVEYNDSLNKLEKRKLEIKAKRLDDDRKASSYIESNPAEKFDKAFVKLADLLYPRMAAGISLSANTSDRNQIRYNLNVSIEGDGSDGIGDASILCFDWIILTMGLNHKMKMLWHDNRLFADIDPKVRATWLQKISEEAKARNLQYIISLNTENFEAMKDHLPPEFYSELIENQIAKLKGDLPENKLLGIQFG